MKYDIQGSPFPAVVCTMEAGKSVRCQKGAMAWMSPNMEMQTKGGGLGKMFGKMVTGESLFENIYTAQGGEGMIAFTTGVPGVIIPFELNGSNCIIAQKSAFLACDDPVQMEVSFQKKIGAGFFGGEGFIMQKFTGVGTVLLEADGSVISYDLAPGQTMICGTGALCAMESTVQMDIETVKGLGNMLAGGEGFFNTKLTGPGKIWLQTMPVFDLAGAIAPYIPSKG
ncbi:MAG: TIGR00266 family protein [Lachnospiraceae bacterium]|nr:TIGR00266 family protein [Lachnospiraceae bacterium]